MKCKNILKEVASWIAALFSSFMIANFCLPFYFYEPGWIQRDEGATRGIYEPNRRIVRADEGFTVTSIDRNGYINQSTDLTDSGYVLVMGNSQSNGCNVMPDKKWIALLNSKIQNVKNEDTMQVYNLSVGGSQFCDQIQGIQAAMEEFPDSNALIIQITSTDMLAEELSAIEQREFIEEARGEYLVTHLNFKQKLRNAIKDVFPLIVYISELKLSKIELGFGEAFLHGNQNIVYMAENLKWGPNEEKKYQKSLRDALLFLKNTYHGELIILNIPGISLQTEQMIMVNAGYYEEIFREICEQNDIYYLNMGEIYQKEYEDKRILPYGFSNTSPGTGHLNKNGHQMVADVLYLLLKEKGVVQ